jgi:hypothetical protein
MTTEKQIKIQVFKMYAVDSPPLNLAPVSKTMLTTAIQRRIGIADNKLEITWKEALVLKLRYLNEATVITTRPGCPVNGTAKTIPLQT